MQDQIPATKKWPTLYSAVGLGQRASRGMAESAAWVVALCLGAAINQVSGVEWPSPPRRSSPGAAFGGGAGVLGRPGFAVTVVPPRQTKVRIATTAIPATAMERSRLLKNRLLASRMGTPHRHPSSLSSYRRLMRRLLRVHGRPRRDRAHGQSSLGDVGISHYVP